MNELIIKIGPLFWVLSVLAVYALAVVAERILYFHRIQINTGDFLRGISKLVNAGKTDEARHEASILPGPAARVVSSVLAHAGLRREELRTVAEDSVQMEVFQIEKNIRGLLVVATVSPLVGVLDDPGAGVILFPAGGSGREGSLSCHVGCRLPGPA